MLNRRADKLELIRIAEAVALEKSIDKELIIGSMENGIAKAAKSKFGSEKFWFDTTNYKELIDIRIKFKNNYFKFLVPKDRLTSSSARIFGLWITVPALIMVIISLIFLKNQTRPITALAKAAEKFGRGEEIDAVSYTHLTLPTTPYV